MLKYRHSKLNILATLLGIFILITFLQVGVSGGAVYAAAETANYDNTDVMTDLEGSTIDGKPFELTDYGFDEARSLQVISFVEYCYSFYSDNQQDYALYVYIYNPQGLNIDDDSELNYIQLSYAGDNYQKYPLQFLDKSTLAGYEAMFYKYKVSLTDEQRELILDTLDSNARVYKVSGVELLIEGDYNATEFEVANAYTYTGFSLGYGHSSATESSLTCTSSGFLTLTLDVRGAAYTPEGASGNNYTRDMLHSVYFAVPNEIVAEYGGISKIYARWLNAVTKPIFITDNGEMYNAIRPDIGKTIPDHLDYRETQPYGFASDIAIYNSSHSYDGWEGQYSGEIIDSLYYLFLANNENSYINDYGQYVLSGDVVLDYIRNYSDSHSSSSLVADKYSADLFSDYDDQFTYVEVEADDGYTLTSEKLTQTFWEKFFNLDGSQVISTQFENINAIYEVQSEDVTDDSAETCANLYINESYYDDFKSFYDSATESGQTIYIFRYYQSEYLCGNADASKWVGTWLQPNLYGTVDGQHYVAQTHVIIDFDIIKVRFSKGEVNTVIPVVMSPIDIVPDLEPPVVIWNVSGFWLYAAIMIAALIVFYVVYRIINKGVTEARQENATAEMAEYAKRRNSNARKSKSKKE